MLLSGITEEIVTNPLLRFLDVVSVVFSVTGATVTLVGAAVLLRKEIFHVNIRVILINSFLSLAVLFLGKTGEAVFNTVLAWRYSENLLLLSNSSAEAKGVTTKASCVWALLPGLIGALVLIVTVSLLTVERILATTYHRTYEHWRASIFVYLLVTLSLWVGSVLVLLPTSVRSMRDERPMFYCSLYGSQYSAPGGNVLPMVTSLDVVFFVVVWIVHLLNGKMEENSRPKLKGSRRQSNEFQEHSVEIPAYKIKAADEKDDGYQLGRRFQLSDNVKLSAIVIRIVIGHFLSVTGFALFIVFLTRSDFGRRNVPPTSGLVLTQLYSVAQDGYGFYLFLLCCQNSRAFSAEVTHMLPACIFAAYQSLHRGHKIDVKAQQEMVVVGSGNNMLPIAAAEHFDLLNSLWADPRRYHTNAQPQRSRPVTTSTVRQQSSPSATPPGAGDTPRTVAWAASS